MGFLLDSNIDRIHRCPSVARKYFPQHLKNMMSSMIFKKPQQDKIKVNDVSM